MIYHLVEYLKGAGLDIPGMGLFNYLSFRAISAFTIALLVSIFAGKRIIRWIQKKQIGEEIRDLGLEGQMQKKGTPTMGGIIIFLAIMVPVLLFADLTNIYTVLLLISVISGIKLVRIRIITENNRKNKGNGGGKNTQKDGIKKTCAKPLQKTGLT